MIETLPSHQLPAPVVAVPLPAMGEGICRATVLRWSCPLGEWVDAGAPLAEIATDKVTTELIAPSPGYVVAQEVSAGGDASVGQIVAVLATKPEVSEELVARVRIPSGPTVTPEPRLRGSPVRPVQACPGGGDPRIMPRHAGPLRATPLARSLASRWGVPLGQVCATRRDGVITHGDVHAHLSRPLDPLALDHPMRCLETTHDPACGQEQLDGVPVHRTPMDHVRRTTASRMIESVAISPHVSTFWDADLDAVCQHRSSFAPDLRRPTYTAYLIHAAAQALAAYPQVYAAVDGHDILQRNELHIGCAVATPYGLVVPVLRHLSSQPSLGEIHHQLTELSARARAGKLAPQELQGAGFTITNPGVYGCRASTPILNQPQVAILSIGAVRDEVCPAAARRGQLRVVRRCTLGLTFDHRALDGEVAVRFLAMLHGHLQSYQPEQIR